MPLREIEIMAKGARRKSPSSRPWGRAGVGSVAPLPLAHGGDLLEAHRRFPDAPQPWIDLSTGINPWPYPLPALAGRHFASLPSGVEQASLESQAADAYGAPASSVVVATPGTQAAIQWLPHLVPPSRVAVLSPTYGEHAPAWRAAGHQVEAVDRLEGLTSADIAVLVNPNNPDGLLIGREALLALADAKARTGGFLLVDEAFADVVPAASLCSHAGRPGLIVLRSFGKFFGLAGIRLGFALAPVSCAARLREAMGPWAICGPAIAIGRAALADKAWQDATRSRLAEAARALSRHLEAAGLEVLGGTCLYRLVHTGAAPRLFQALGEAGLFVRSFPERPERLRFGLPPSEEATERLVCVLRARI
jgi:cobalamin biosynthesis protein CobC